MPWRTTAWAHPGAEDSGRHGACRSTATPATFHRVVLPGGVPFLGGSIKEREQKRYEITHVPALIRHRDRLIGTGEAVLSRYERITFERALINPMGQPLATFVCPGHPLLDATIDLILERNRDLLKRGATLIEPDDPTEDIRALFYLEHTIQDARTITQAIGASFLAVCNSSRSMAAATSEMPDTHLILTIVLSRLTSGH